MCEHFRCNILTSSTDRLSYDEDDSKQLSLNHLENIDMLKNEIVNVMFYLHLAAKTQWVKKLKSWKAMNVCFSLSTKMSTVELNVSRWEHLPRKHKIPMWLQNSIWENSQHFIKKSWTWLCGCLTGPWMLISGE